MRPTPVDADDIVQFHPPPAPPCHDVRACSWRPYSNSRDFEANAAVVLIILLCGLICALALNTAIRCFLRRGGHNDTLDTSLPQTQQQQHDNPKPTLDARIDAMKMAPTLVFSAGMKPKLAGAEAECTICLSEFSEGEEIRVLAICKHGFHVQCIQEWLTLHSSCPTCRRSCASLPPSSSEHTGNQSPSQPFESTESPPSASN